MPLPVDIEILSPQQNYFLCELAKYSSVLVNYQDKSISEILSLCSWNKELNDVIKHMVDLGMGNIIIRHAEHDNSCGFGAIMFEDDYGNKGFAFEPTDIEDYKDWLTDISIASTNDSEQYRRATEFFEKHKGDNQKNFLFGYSLGGNLAMFIYREYSEFISKVNVFNALPINGWVLTDEDKIKINQWAKDGDNVHMIGVNIDHSNEDHFKGKHKIGHDGPLNEHTDNIDNSYFFDDNENTIGGYTPFIKVDTWKLRDYGMRLEKVQERVRNLNSKLDNFRNPFENLAHDIDEAISKTLEKFNDIFSDFNHVVWNTLGINTGSKSSYNKYTDDFDLGKCCSYIFWTCDEIEKIEHQMELELTSCE